MHLSKTCLVAGHLLESTISGDLAKVAVLGTVEIFPVTGQVVDERIELLNKMFLDFKKKREKTC